MNSLNANEQTAGKWFQSNSCRENFYKQKILCRALAVSGDFLNPLAATVTNIGKSFSSRAFKRFGAVVTSAAIIHSPFDSQRNNSISGDSHKQWEAKRLSAGSRLWGYKAIVKATKIKKNTSMLRDTSETRSLIKRNLMPLVWTISLLGTRNRIKDNKAISACASSLAGSEIVCFSTTLFIILRNDSIWAFDSLLISRVP